MVTYACSHTYIDTLSTLMPKSVELLLFGPCLNTSAMVVRHKCAPPFLTRKQNGSLECFTNSHNNSPRRPGRAKFAVLVLQVTSGPPLTSKQNVRECLLQRHIPHPPAVAVLDER